MVTGHASDHSPAPAVSNLGSRSHRDPAPQLHQGSRGVGEALREVAEVGPGDRSATRVERGAKYLQGVKDVINHQLPVGVDYGAAPPDQVGELVVVRERRGDARCTSPVLSLARATSCAEKFLVRARYNVVVATHPVQFDCSPEDVAVQHVADLEPVEPYRLDLTAWVLRRRPQNRIDQWRGAYRRALMVNGRALSIEVAAKPGSSALQVSVLTPGHLSGRDRLAIRGQVELLLGTRVDLQSFYRLVDNDPDFRGLKDRFLGVHPTQFPSLFESMVNAIANQQLSLEVGIELLNRFTERFGTRPGDGHGLVAFPEPEAVIGASLAELRALGFSDRKGEYILECAHAIAIGALRTQSLEDAPRSRARDLLLSVRGIGPWSADYIMLRGMGRLDVYPADDVGARNKLQALLSLEVPPSRDEIVEITTRWEPWAGMAYFHLLLEGLAQRGCLDD